MNTIERCKKHKNFTLIERVIVENCVTFDDSEPQDENDWTGEPIKWYDPQPLVLIVTCFDCGFEQFYGPRAKRPKWIQEAWEKLMKAQYR